jgi:probable rRNA maturation factor
VTITLTDTCRTRQSAYLRRHLAAARHLLSSGPEELSVALVDEPTMARLHRQFLGVRGPTDVLTFELDHGPENRVTSGEIVICAPYARRQAVARGVAWREELLLYALHGLLHLSGHDDRTRSGFDRMHRAEDMILSKLGIGPVFSRGTGGRATDAVAMAAARRRGGQG